MTPTPPPHAHNPLLPAPPGLASPYSGWDPAALALAQQQMAAAAAAQVAAAAAAARHAGQPAAPAPPPSAPPPASPLLAAAAAAAVASPSLKPAAGSAASDAGGGGEGGKAKRARLVWTPALHQRFLDAVAKLGEEAAVPKTIMNVSGGLWGGEKEGGKREKSSARTLASRPTLPCSQHTDDERGRPVP